MKQKVKGSSPFPPVMLETEQIKDSDIWHDAAQVLYNAVSQLKTGVEFSNFNYIMLHNIYLLTSFLYYKLNENIITDQLFDKLCKYLLENYEEVEKVVRHKEQTLSKDRLRAGTGYDIQLTPIWWNILLHYRKIGDNVKVLKPVKKTTVPFF